jgi:serine/threonine-protein kinase
MRLTFSAASNRYPLWMPDGKHIVFGQGAVGADNGIWWIRSDGSGKPEKLLGTKELLHVTSLSPDGGRVVYNQTDTSTGADIWTLPLDLKDPDHPRPGKPELFLRDPAEQFDGALSPDGRWMAYVSNESGAQQVFVRPFPAAAAGGKWQISSTGGRFPMWSKSGRELFYVSSAESRIMVAEYTAKADSFTAGKPVQWSPLPVQRAGNNSPLDLAPDGQHFVGYAPPSQSQGDDKTTLHVTVLLNFFDELRRRMPVGK